VSSIVVDVTLPPLSYVDGVSRPMVADVRQLAEKRGAKSVRQP
jgi:hypothetical protein